MGNGPRPHREFGDFFALGFEDVFEILKAVLVFRNVSAEFEVFGRTLRYLTVQMIDGGFQTLLLGQPLGEELAPLLCVPHLIH